jgi:hypothetical protein
MLARIAPTSLAVLPLVTALALTGEVRAQCAAFTPGFGPRGVDGSVRAIAVWDDGGGPALFAAGDFTTAGGAQAFHVAKWDGMQFSPLGGGLSGPARALCVFDDGTGPKLVVGGEFLFAGGVLVDRVAKWDGTAWSSVGGVGFNGAVNALGVHDDGSGPKLFAGGEFTNVAGGATLLRLARLDPTGWAQVGPGVSGPVHALASFDEGSGPRLWVGAFVNTTGTSNVLRWDGATLASPGFGTNQVVRALAVLDDGGGPGLYLGGDFTLAGGLPANRVARWRGGTLAPLGAGLGGSVRALATLDDGFGPKLHVGGDFLDAGGAPAERIATWNGTTWATPGFGLDATVAALASHVDGGGLAVFVGGDFHGSGSLVARGIALIRNGVLQPVGGEGVDGDVIALETFDDGSGPALYAGGYLSSAGGVDGTLFRWDGVAWSALRNFPDSRVWDFAVFDPGTGPALYAVENIYVPALQHLESRLLRWNGTDWTVEHVQPYAGFYSLGTFDDGSGPALYVGGRFANVAGVPGTKEIARWNGSAWSAVGGGIPNGSTLVWSQLPFDDGSGPALYVGTNTGITSGSAFDRHIARWNGSTWSAVGVGFDGPVYELTTFDFGSGPALVAGGNFFQSGATQVRKVARWTGASWVPIGTGIPSSGVDDLIAYDDRTGHGAELYAVGSFFTTPVPWRHFARFRNGSWEPLLTGFDTYARTLAVFDDHLGPAPALYVGGPFSTADGLPSNGIARYVPTALPGCTGDPGVPFCFGDALDTQVTQVCPCFNYGGPRRGCANNVNPDGAELVASGSTAIDAGTGTDSVVLASSGMPATAGLGSVFLQGDAELPGGTSFGDGVRCADGTLIRLAYKPNHGGAALYPDVGNLSLSQRGGVVPGSGASRAYQVYYRSAAAAFCPPATFNVTNGVRVVW